MILRKIGYAVREAVNSLWQYRVRNLFSATIICLSFLTLGIFLSLSNNLQNIAHEITYNMTAVIFLEKDISPQERSEIEEELKSLPTIVKQQYVSTHMALEQFREKFPELRDILESLNLNPFPESFEIVLDEKKADAETISSIIQKFETMTGVEDVQFNQEQANKMQSLSRLSQAVGFFLGGILILASFLIISNIIKLNVIARQNEIEILRLVGATNMFIRIPFFIEGIILGIFGGILSLFLLYILVNIFPLYLGTSLGALNRYINFQYLSLTQALAIIAGGAVIGLLGSSSSLSRFLKT